LIARRVPLFEFAIRAELAKYNLTTPEGRISALNAAAPLVAQIRDKSLRPEYSRSLAGWLGVEVEQVSGAVATAMKKTPQISVDPTAPEVVPQEWRPDPQEPRLILEREVLKARLQAPAFSSDFNSLEASAFTHPAYQELRAVIDQIAPENTALTIDKITNENMKSLFTELNVEPIRADGAVTEHYVASIIARLREVSVSRAIAELKSSLQRLNPVENEAEYNAAFAQLVALESTRRTLHDLALGGL